MRVLIWIIKRLNNNQFEKVFNDCCKHRNIKKINDLQLRIMKLEQEKARLGNKLNDLEDAIAELKHRYIIKGGLLK
jgi:predicted nuclease with TOPRIM domain